MVIGRYGRGTSTTASSVSTPASAGERPLHAVAVRRDLGRLAGQWDELVDLAPVPSPFLRSWWLAAVAAADARFVLVTAGDLLLGGFAFESSSFLGVERLRALGEGPLCPDHLDLVARPGTEDIVAAGLSSWLRRPGNRIVDISGLSEQHRLGAALGPGATTCVVEVAPWTPLDDDFAVQQARFPSMMRNTIRRSRRRLEREGAVLTVVPPGDVTAAIDGLVDLHRRQWGEDGFLRAEAAFRRAAHAGAARGEVVFLQFAADGVVGAVDVAFAVGGRLSYYQGGREGSKRWAGAGTVVMARLVEWGCEQGHREFDLLRGSEAYKRDWAGAERHVLRVRAAYGPGARAVARAVRLREEAPQRPAARRVIAAGRTLLRRMRRPPTARAGP